MIQELKNEKFVKKVSVEYVDGTKEDFGGEFLVLITDNGNEGKWNVKLSEEADLDKVLNFAYDAVDEIENASLDEVIPKKASHLRLVKG